MEKIAVLRFEESNAPQGDDPFVYDVLIKTSMNEEKLWKLIKDICNTKEFADDGLSRGRFNVPEDWEDFGWHEKIDYVIEFYKKEIADFDFVNFEIVSCEVN